MARYYVLALWLSARTHADVFGELSRATFLNAGVSRATDVLVAVPFAVSYMEPDDVLTPNVGWGEGAFTYTYLVNGTEPPPNGTCAPVLPQLVGFDIPGNDISSASSADAPACGARCCATTACNAFLFEPAADAPVGACTVGAPCCFLKSAWAPPRAKPAGFAVLAGNVSGGRTPLPPLADPPLGVRSAPPLGGVSTGGAELRGDGSLREWLLLNQGPAGSSKWGLIDDAWLALRARGATRMLRTAPPAYARAAGVAALNFSGSWPLTRLAPLDDALPLDAALVLYAYSTFVPGDLGASAVPAIAFSLTVANTGVSPLPVSFMLNLPLGGTRGCARAGDGAGGDGAAAATAAACLHACDAAPACSSWQFVEAAEGGGGECTLNADVPLTAGAHNTTTCGVAGGGWTAADGALGLALRPRSGAAANASSVGDVALRLVADGAAGAPALSFAAADDAADVLAAFARDGGFVPGARGLAAAGGSFAGAAAAHGAAALSAIVPPGGNATLTVVFSWGFPNRDWNGAWVGNGYSTLYPDAHAAGAALGSGAALSATLAAINAHHAVFAHADNPAPVWLKDMLLNQFSHLHMLMWLADGRLREYEAYSCDDVDSVHNDFQRHLFYLWALPAFEDDKLRAWGSWAQAPDGHVLESLAGGCGGGRPGALDEPGGRTMGDTTTLFVLETLEMWRHTGDAAALGAAWPAAKRALAWCMANAGAHGGALPQHLETTYDHFGFGDQRFVAYNAFVYITALAAGAEVADAAGDAPTAAAARAARADAQAAATALLWNGTADYSSGFFRAWANDAPAVANAIFTDTLYGAMLGTALGLGAGVDARAVAAHLDAEWAANADAFGMRVMTNPRMEDSVWMNGPPTWSYLALVAAGADASAAARAAAFEPLQRMVENYRSRLHDLWNLRALTHSETEGSVLEHGGPREQGHYGFMLTDAFLWQALSGQATRLDAGALAFAPLYAPPFALPLLLRGTEGTLAADAAGRVTVALAFGALALPPGGLRVTLPSGVCTANAEALALGPGDSVAITAPCTPPRSPT